MWERTRLHRPALEGSSSNFLVSASRSNILDVGLITQTLLRRQRARHLWVFLGDAGYGQGSVGRSF